MGTDVPDFVRGMTFELPSINFTKEYFDSCTTVALQAAADFYAEEIWLIGYDGYSGNVLSEKEAALTGENRTLFADFKAFHHKPLISLTPTVYKELDVNSLYQKI
jgi:4-hydroxy 2-oxovalerate aldolase